MISGNQTQERIQAAVLFLQKAGISDPAVGIVLGTGLGAFIGKMDQRIEIEYASIPHFPIATVEHHKGRLVYGKVAGRSVLVMQGRFHFYEGHSMDQIVFPIRVMKMLGIKKLFLTNVSGGINPGLKKGDMVLLEDHINLQSSNPLIGPNAEELGPRFPDMSRPYDRDLSEMIRKAGSKHGHAIKHGVYVAVNGPQLETRAEYRYLRLIGADMVGMSTVPEVIAANHMGLPCCAVSIITDECDPDNLAPIDITEIIAIAGTADKKMADILRSVIAGTGAELE